MFKKIVNFITGGRPMTFVSMGFRDIVTGKMVNVYKDGYGRLWLATSRWGWDRETRYHE